MKSVVALALIDNIFDVRVHAGENNEERVDLFAGLYEAGHELPPIVIVEKGDGRYWLEEGRTRLAALKQLGRTETEVVIIQHGKNVAQSVADAYVANTRGSQPPTRRDLQLTVEQLLEKGWSPRQIKEALAVESPRRLDEALRCATALQHKRTLAKAKARIAHAGLTVEEAAAEFCIKPDCLKAEIEGKERKPVRWLKMELSSMTKQYRTRSTTNKSWMDRLQKALEDGVPIEDLEKAYMTQINRFDQQKRHFEEGLLRLRRRYAALNNTKPTAKPYTLTSFAEDTATEEMVG